MKAIRISCEIPIKEYRCIERLVDSGKYKSINDFVQVAVRKLLAEEMGVDLDAKTLKMIMEALGIK